MINLITVFRTRAFRYAWVPCLLPLVATAQVGKLSTIHAFSGSDGAGPIGGLTMVSNGSLFGTTSNGGTGFGTAFELMFDPQTGTWTETLLHTFTGTDGENPSSKLIRANGALFGTAYNGGAKSAGTVFELTEAAPGGPFTETTVYNFQGGTDGRGPYSNLVVDSSGNLFGTTTYGGGTSCDSGVGCGTVFELSPPAVTGGAYSETVLYRFQPGVDANNPQAGLLMDKKGELYGTAMAGGISGDGAVFRLQPPAAIGDPWTESVIYSFTSRTDGEQPAGALSPGVAGGLYGTTEGGGSSGCGTVFLLYSPGTLGATWIKTILHEFTCSDGAYPQGTLILKPGAILGNTSGGGQFQGGTVFALLAPTVAGNPWTEVTLYDFQSSTSGATPSGNLAINAAGTLFGVTADGGTAGHGTVFQLIP